MIIKRRISFFLQKLYNDTNNGESQIRMRVRWNNNLAQFNCGYTIDPAKWDTEQTRCKRNTSNSRGYSASDINKELSRLEGLANDCFKSFEVNEYTPTLQEYKDSFNSLNGKKMKIVQDEKPLASFLIEFQQDQGSKNNWSEATYIKIHGLGRHLHKFNSSLGLNDFTDEILSAYMDYLRDVANFRNSTLDKHWKMLTWFLRWAESNDYLTCKDFRKFEIKPKTVKNKIIYLSWDELMKVYNLTFPEDKQYLERARDLFCFQCFTSLRYSDLAALRHEDISGDAINFCTKKTSDMLSIDLNKYSRSILEKYKDDDNPLPVISNQKLNDYVKTVCFLAEINEPIKTIYYKGSERIEEVKPKYELITTHTGRRTFICNALSLGISPVLVMQWTGHSDYKAMKPYIAQLNEAKKEAMESFNR